MVGDPWGCTALQLLTDLAEKFKTRPFSYFWAEGGQQPALEASVGVGGCVLRVVAYTRVHHTDVGQESDPVGVPRSLF